MIRIPTDDDIRALIARARAGELDQYTRDRIGGSTIRATVLSLMSIRPDCALCGRTMASTGNHDQPNVHHMAGAHHTYQCAGGWLMRASVLHWIGHACMTLGCSSCNQAAARDRRDILPSDLLHNDHYVFATAGKPPPWHGDQWNEARLARLGW